MDEMTEKQEEATRTLEAIGNMNLKKELMSISDYMEEDSSRHYSNTMLSPVVLEAIQNDAQIKALQKGLDDLVQHQSPKYVLKTNGEMEVVYSEEYNRLFTKFVEQIEHRQSQIVSAYNCP